MVSKNDDEIPLIDIIREYEDKKTKNCLSKQKIDLILSEINLLPVSFTEKMKHIDDIAEKCYNNFDLNAYYMVYLYKTELIIKNENGSPDEMLESVIKFCEIIPLIKEEMLKTLISFLEKSSKAPPDVVTKALVVVNIKLGMSALFNKNYSEAIRVLNTARELSEETNEHNLTLMSTLMIANILPLIGKYSEAIQLIDMLMMECKAMAFYNFCNKSSSKMENSGAFKRLLFSEEFYRETSDMFDKVLPQLGEYSLSSAFKDTIQSKIKNNATLKKIEYKSNEIIDKFNQMFEK